MEPEVSIIIPAYNTESYIAEAIESVLNQTLKDIEIIVVDDASTDQTVSVVRNFTDPRLKLLQNLKNLGVSASRNHALQYARGKWIAVLDSDDWYAPDRLEKLLKVAEEEQADLIIDDLNLVQADNLLPWSTLLRESGETVNEIQLIEPIFYVRTGIYGKRGLHLGLCKPIFRRSFLDRHHLFYAETQHVVEDFHLVLRCLIYGASMFFVPIPYYFYRSRPNSLVTRSKVKHIGQFRNAILSVLKYDIVRHNSELMNVLSESLDSLRRNEEYYRVVEPLKQKRILVALVSALRSPYFFVHFVQQIPYILWRRYQYHIVGDKLVYEVAHRKN